MPEYKVYNPWIVVIALMLFALALLGVAEVLGQPDAQTLCINPPPAEYDDPCYPDRIILYEKNTGNVERGFWSSGSVTVRDGMVFFQRKNTGTWYAIPSERTWVKYDLGACLECE